MQILWNFNCEVILIQKFISSAWGVLHKLSHGMLLLMLPLTNSALCQVLNPSQEEHCLTTGNSQNFVPLENVHCPFSSVLPTDLASLPVITINVNIHFVKYAGNNLVPEGNFTPLTSNSDPFNGNLIAKLLIDGCNEDAQNVVANPLNNAKGYPNYIGDAKLRLHIQADPTNPNDYYNGVWYWNSEPTSFPNKNVLNIVISGKEGYFDGVYGETKFNTNRIDLYNLYRLTYNNQANWTDYKRLIWHELGHAYGNLCHSFSISNMNVCAFKDLNTPGECGKSKGTIDCGGTDKPNCDNWTTLSNNIMGFNGKLPWSISPCQWLELYKGLYTSLYESTIDFCSDSSQAPLVIPSGSTQTWESLKLINRDIVVQTGAQLTVRCEVRMGSNKSIQVQRGARLILDGGIIRNLCYEKSWAGIYVEGNSSIEQPSHESLPNPTQAGIVYLKNNSRIEHAIDAIATARYGDRWNEVYWGGLVFAENSYLLNNLRAASFMKYNFANKSRFYNCTMNESGVFDKSVGVTIWDCKGISFEQNNLGPFDHQAIYGINMGISIKNNNQIHDCSSGGICSTVTTPVFGNKIELIGDPLPNLFKNNKVYDIYLAGTDIAGGLLIEKNNFTANTAPDYPGIILSAYSKIDINNNYFETRTNGINVNDTQYPGFVYCNTFVSTSNSIVLTGNNENTLVYNNIFNTDGDNIAILKAGSLGKIFSPQTSTPFSMLEYMSSENCFSSNNFNDIFASPSQTEAFRYKYYQQGNSCVLPKNNLSDGGINNYVLEPAPHDNKSCPAPILTFPTNEEYVAWLNYTGELKSQYQTAPGNSTADAYHFADLKLQQWRAMIVGQAMDSMNYSMVKTALASDTILAAKKMKFGIELAQHNYANAQNILNQMPNVTIEDQYFKYTQQLWLVINQMPWSEPLTNDQIINLNTISKSQEPSRVYAIGILALKTGSKFYPGVLSPNHETEFRSSKNQIVLVHESKWKVSPNPKQSGLTQLVGGSFNENLEIDVYNISGKTVYHKPINKYSEPVWLDLSNQPNGIYFINVKTASNSTTLKFIKQ